jgi:nucleotide-binding universal stress UspA family protein
MPLFAWPRRADALDGIVDYLVDTPDGSVGVVDGWTRDERGQAQALIVAQGWFGRRRFEIPLDALIEIDHEDRRIILARGAAPLEPKGPFQRLVELGQDRSAEETAAAFPPRSDQARPVLCGVADDPHASTVVAVAARLARALAAPLILAHVTPARVPPGVSAAPDGQARLREEEKEQADELIDAVLSRLVLGADVKRVVTRGTPEKTLEELADVERAQLLVIGTSGKGCIGALLRGSVSQHVVSHAQCPVVVVPPDLGRPGDQGDDESGDIPDLAGAGIGRSNWDRLDRTTRMNRRARESGIKESDPPYRRGPPALPTSSPRNTSEPV